MKLIVRWLIYALMLLIFAVIVLLSLVTGYNIFWLSILSFYVAVISAIGTLSQWLFPIPAEGGELSSKTDQRNTAVDNIIVDSMNRQKFEEQRRQAIEQENRIRKKKRYRIILSSVSASILVLSIVAFVYLQMQPQINFVTQDSDYGSRVTSVAWSHDGTSVASATQNGSIRIWDVNNGGTFYVFQESDTNYNAYNNTANDYNSLSWSSDGKYIAFCENDGSVRIVEFSDNHLSSISIDSSVGINTVAWSANSKYIAFGGDNDIVYIAQFSSKKITTTFSDDAPITALAWSKDGKLLASGNKEGKIHVWNTLTGKTIFNPSYYGGEVSSLAWSPSSSTIFASSSSDASDSQVHIWDITKGDTGRPKITYSKHVGGVNNIAWSPDGKEIASVDNGGTLRIWDTDTGKDISVYQDFLYATVGNTNVEVTAVAWSSNYPSTIAIGQSEYDRNYRYNNFFTVRVINFCRSWCLL